MQNLNWKIGLLLGLLIISGVANGYLWSGIFVLANRDKQKAA